MVLEDLFRFRRLTQVERRHYAEYGFVVLEPLVTDAGLRALREQCMDAWYEEKRAFDPAAAWSSGNSIPNIHRCSAAVRDYFFHGPLVNICERLIGSNLKGALAELILSTQGDVKPIPWHQDNDLVQLIPDNAVSAITSLDDMDVEGGCFWVLPGSQRLGRADMAAQLPLDETRAVAIAPRAGECVLIHCWTLYKADGNFSHERDRRLLLLRYADADAVHVRAGHPPLLGRLLRGQTKYPDVNAFESDL